MTVYVFGSNAISQLGLGEDAEDTCIPTPIPYFNNIEITKVACGTLHTLALSSDGKLYSWGCNDENALGRDGDESVPGEVEMKQPVATMSCGASISAALTSSGEVYMWGTFRCSSGVLGFSPSIRLQKYPMKVSLTGIVDLKCGQNFALLLDTKSRLYTMGSNDFGELGRKVSERHRMKSLVPEQINDTRHLRFRFRAIGAGQNHAMAINPNGEMYTWGSNVYGQIDSNVGDYSMRKVKADVSGAMEADGGENHTLVLDNQGQLHGFGRNDYGQLGLGHTNKGSGKLELKGVVKVRAYGNFSICQVGNELFSWGLNICGEAGYKEENPTRPTRIPYEFGEIVDFSIGNNFSVVVAKK